jgi:hypothetical protein
MTDQTIRLTLVSNDAADDASTNKDSSRNDPADNVNVKRSQKSTKNKADDDPADVNTKKRGQKATKA